MVLLKQRRDLSSGGSYEQTDDQPDLVSAELFDAFGDPSLDVALVFDLAFDDVDAEERLA